MRLRTVGGVRMRLQWYRSCSVLIGGLLTVMLVACSLLSLGVSTHAIELPSVLVYTDRLWVGDLCRATQNSAYNTRSNAPLATQSMSSSMGDRCTIIPWFSYRRPSAEQVSVAHRGSHAFLKAWR